MTTKRSLIIAKTPAEAKEHALANDRKDWRFVTNAHDLIDADPATHMLEFVGGWYERADLKQLRECARGRGLSVPVLKQIPRMRVRALSQNMPRADGRR